MSSNSYNVIHFIKGGESAILSTIQKSDISFEDSNQDNLASDSIINVMDLGASDSIEKHVTNYLWPKTGKRYPIISSETVSYQARRTANHNLDNGYTLVTLVGKSGTGKTTLTTTWLHRLHTILEGRGHRYAIDWFEKMDIARMDDIIKGLEKGINRIVVVDDATYGDRELEIEEAEQLMAELTYVRHTLQANVIFVLIMHYSKALGPFLRDGDVTFFTSISPVERENLNKLYGKYARSIIQSFFKKYGSMVAEGYYFSNLDDSKSIRNKTKAPFKMALVNDFGMMHFVNYPEESCPQCEKRIKQDVIRDLPDSLSEKEFMTFLVNAYGYSRTKLCFKVHWYGKGINLFDRNQRQLLARIAEYYEAHKEEYANMLAALSTTKSLDKLFRARGILKGEPNNEEKRANKREQKKLKQLQKELGN